MIVALTAAAYIRGRLAPLVMGQHPRATGRLWRAMAAAAGYDRRGSAMMAAAAINVALHDLAARTAGVPVSALLGSALRAHPVAYASGSFMKPWVVDHRAIAQ